MPRLTRAQDEWDDDHDEDEGPAELDFSEDDDDLCIPCPYCGRQILEESERCPYCAHFISKEDAPSARKPIWFLIGIVACLYVVYRWIVFG